MCISKVYFVGSMRTTSYILNSTEGFIIVAYTEIYSKIYKYGFTFFRNSGSVILCVLAEMTC